MAAKTIKEPTPKQLEARKKFAEASKKKAAERAAAKAAEEFNKAEGLEQPIAAPDVAPTDAPKETISMAEYLDLQRQILEMKQMLLSGVQFPATPNQVGVQGGKLIGSLEKYPLAPTDYPNPIERLFKEARLARFALQENYDLMWKISTVEYTTIDNVRVKEPRFTLELGRKLYDEETGEPLYDEDGNQRGYIISRFIMHEDPDAALVIARDEGIDVDETNEKAFLDEMRYLRCRDWLLECFFPTPIKKMAKKTMVVGGTEVETYTITSTKSEKIPFDKIKGGMIKA